MKYIQMSFLMKNRYSLLLFPTKPFYACFKESDIYYKNINLYKQLILLVLVCANSITL